MKKILFILTLIFTISLNAQDTSIEAKALLDDVTKIVRSYDNISIDFKYVLINTEEDINQETRGDVIMEGEKYLSGGKTAMVFRAIK